MKTLFHTTTIMLIIIGIFPIIGCASKTIEVSNSPQLELKKEKSVWQDIKTEATKKKNRDNKMDNEEDFPSFKILKKTSVNKSKEDCDDCIVDISGKPSQKNIPKKKEIDYGVDDSNVPANSYPKKEESSYDYRLTASDTYQKNLEEENNYIQDFRTAYSKPKNENYSTKVAIQVGAFRRYAGAKVYAKKYDLLSNEYRVKIEKGVKNQEPLYRVKIEGFSSKNEAKKFKKKYSLTGAFLVMK